MSDDPFPREPLGALIGRVPAYGRLAWRLGRDPLLSRARRAAVVAAAGYLASPIDLVPGLIPVLGQLDDIAVVLAALRIALDGLDPARRQAHLAAVGLSDADLATDLRTVGATGAWIGRAGVRTGRRVLGSGVRAAVLGSRVVGRTVRRTVGRTRAAAGNLGSVGRAADRATGAIRRAGQVVVERGDTPPPADVRGGQASSPAARSAR